MAMVCIVLIGPVLGCSPSSRPIPRCVTLADTLANSLVGPGIAKISLQQPWPAQTPTILAALKQSQPELYKRIGTVFFCKDYINYFLTSIISTDVTDMSGAGMLQLPETSYSVALLEHYGIDELAGSLPTLVASDQVIGVVSESAAGLTGPSGRHASCCRAVRCCRQRHRQRSST